MSDDVLDLEADQDDLLDEARDDTWKPVVDKGPPKHLVPRFTPPEDPNREFDPDEVMEFLEKRFDGWGPNEIALSLNWGSKALHRFITTYGELISMIEEATHESVERAVIDAARRGNVPAMALYLKHKARHRGWDPPTNHLKIDARSQHEIVVSVRQALDEQTRQMLSEGDPADQLALLQGLPSFDEDDIVEAELVE